MPRNRRFSAGFAFLPLVIMVAMVGLLFPTVKYITDPNVKFDLRNFASQDKCVENKDKNSCQALGCVWKSGTTKTCSSDGTACKAGCTSSTKACSDFANQTSCGSMKGCSWREIEQESCKTITKTVDCSYADCTAKKSGCSLSDITHAKCSIARLNDGKELCEGGGGKWETSKSTTCSGSYETKEEDCDTDFVGSCLGNFYVCSGTYEDGGICEQKEEEATTQTASLPQKTDLPQMDGESDCTEAEKSSCQQKSGTCRIVSGRATCDIASKICDDGEYRCSGSKLEQCINGLSWSAKQTCSATENCNAGSGACVPKSAPVSIDDECSADTDCTRKYGTGYICDKSRQPYSCRRYTAPVVKKVNGATCSIGSECQSGICEALPGGKYCVAQAVIKPVALGGVCGTTAYNRVCEGGLYCVNNVCDDKPKPVTTEEKFDDFFGDYTPALAPTSGLPNPYQYCDSDDQECLDNQTNAIVGGLALGGQLQGAVFAGTGLVQAGSNILSVASGLGNGLTLTSLSQSSAAYLSTLLTTQPILATGLNALVVGGAAYSLVECEKDPYGEVCLSFAAGLQADPFAAIEIGQAATSLVSQTIGYADNAFLSFTSSSYFDDFDVPVFGGGGTYWDIQTGSTGSRLTTTRIGSFGYSSSEAATWAATWPESILYDYDLGTPAFRVIDGEQIERDTFDYLVTQVKRASLDNNWEYPTAMAKVINGYSPTTYDPTSFVSKTTIEDPSALSAQLLCGNRLNCFELPVLEQAILAELGVSSQPIVGFGGTYGLDVDPYKHGALRIGDEILGYYAPYPTSYADFQVKADRLEWGDFGIDEIFP